jgi:hypothetical protein
VAQVLSRPPAPPSASAPTPAAPVAHREVRRLLDRYLAALGLAPAARRKAALEVLGRARRRDGGSSLEALWLELARLESCAPAALPPEHPAPMPEHDLAIAWAIWHGRRS